jgi:hypothetical protein
MRYYKLRNPNYYYTLPLRLDQVDELRGAHAQDCRSRRHAVRALEIESEPYQC